MGDKSEAAASNKRAIKQITLLMPVWGYQFIGRFLEFCLPTLLAPNNIPAIAQAKPCRFILLSSVADEPVIRSHPAWQKLERHCACEIQSIDDLITQGNHTATITLAFERALRQSGDAMRDTCFIFLMSDYLVADGSLKTVLRTIETGASAVLAGNFQIIAEDAAPLLAATHRSRVARDRIAAPGPRAMVARPSASGDGGQHRQFRPDPQRPYQPAVLARRRELPDRTFLSDAPDRDPSGNGDFVVGSSWDYSFVPELCPSGNIAALTDSDDYLVVELQRRDYEWENLRPGPVIAADLARSLAEWTTDYHRRNVAQTVVFHAADRPANLAQSIAESDAFVDSVTPIACGAGARPSAASLLGRIDRR